MTLPNKIFFTGAPGSCWSATAQLIEEVPGFNISDRSPQREYDKGHRGSYFGTGMEFEPDYMNPDQAFTDTSGCKLIKSHEWAYQLKDIQVNRPNDWILLMYRPSYRCHNWWMKSGGFNITYPDYSWYKDGQIMLEKIREQNALMLDFAYDNNLQWSQFNMKWLREIFGQEISDIALDADSPKDILVTVYKP